MCNVREFLLPLSVLAGRAAHAVATAFVARYRWVVPSVATA
jgi:hypothetical protein